MADAVPAQSAAAGWHDGPVTTTPEPSPAEVLNLALLDNDAEASTVREYLIELLRTLWREEANFSGKYPFGDSGWQYDIYEPMVRAGWVAGKFDEEDILEDVDHKAADRLIDKAIRSLADAPS